MSWDIVLLNPKNTVSSLSEIKSTILTPTDFYTPILEKFKGNYFQEEDHILIKGNLFSIEFFTQNEPIENTILMLQGEKALFNLIPIAKENSWQIYDTSIDQFIDLENPSINGYKNFQEYLKKVLLG
jgi:hypothetical protein